MNKTGFLTADLSNNGDNEALKYMVQGNNVICHWSCKNSLYNDQIELDCNSDSTVLWKDGVDDLLKYFAILFL